MLCREFRSGATGERDVNVDTAGVLRDATCEVRLVGKIGPVELLRVDRRSGAIVAVDHIAVGVLVVAAIDDVITRSAIYDAVGIGKVIVSIGENRAAIVHAWHSVEPTVS